MRPQVTGPANTTEHASPAQGEEVPREASAQADENTKGTGPTQLSEAEQRQVRELQARDREVRAHEQAHLAAAGPHARGGASYTYQRGPDGRQYAVGGEVGIDTSPVAGDPQATLLKAQIIARAALAPAEPSAQDRRVAAAAANMANQARAELAQEARTDHAGSSAAVAQYLDVHGAAASSSLHFTA